MERAVGQVRTEARRMLDYIRRDDEHNPAFLLDLAQALHPDPFCVKYVPAAAAVETDMGRIYMLSINGRPTSTPAHIQNYHPDHLERLARKIPDTAPEKIPLMQGIAATAGKAYVSCPELRQVSGTDTCLTGFTFGENGRATRKSREFCPNSQSACSERILLHWLRYALAVQNITREEMLIIPDVVFSPTQPPRVRFTTDLGKPLNEMRLPEIADNECAGEAEVTMVSQVLPCTTCSHALVDRGVRNVWIREFSKYVPGDGTVLIDADDTEAFYHMIANGVNISSGSENIPVLRT